MEDVSDWLSGDAIAWGKRPKWVQNPDGQWRIGELKPQWVARFVKNPRTGEECIVFFCDSEKKARQIYTHAFKQHGKRFIMDRIKRCTKMTFGRLDWMRPVCLFIDEPQATKTPHPYVIPYDYYNEDDVPTRFRGPYGTTFGAPDEDDDEPKIWLNSIGQYVEPGEVNDILVDTTLLSERDFESICEQQGWLERKAAIELERSR